MGRQRKDEERAGGFPERNPCEVSTGALVSAPGLGSRDDVRVIEGKIRIQ
jgi:hypothetical protein